MIHDCMFMYDQFKKKIVREKHTGNNRQYVLFIQGDFLARKKDTGNKANVINLLMQKS